MTPRVPAPGVARAVEHAGERRDGAVGVVDRGCKQKFQSMGVLVLRYPVSSLSHRHTTSLTEQVTSHARPKPDMFLPFTVIEPLVDHFLGD